MQNNRKPPSETKAETKDSPQIESKAMRVLNLRAFKITTNKFFKDGDFCSYSRVSRSISDCKWVQEERERRKNEKFYSSYNVISIDKTNCLGETSMFFVFRGCDNFYISTNPKEAKDNKMTQTRLKIKEPVKTAIIMSAKTVRTLVHVAFLTFTGKVYVGAIWPRTDSLQECIVIREVKLPQPAVNISRWEFDSILILTKEKKPLAFKYIDQEGKEMNYGVRITSKVMRMPYDARFHAPNASGVYWEDKVLGKKFTQALPPMSEINEILNCDRSTYFHMLNGDVYMVGEDFLTKQCLPYPTKMNLPRIKKLYSGEQHMIAITFDGRAYGWGHNNFCQLGIEGVDDYDAQIAPREIPNLVGHAIHACVGGCFTIIFTRLGNDIRHFAFGHLPVLGKNDGDPGPDNLIGPFEIPFLKKLTALPSEEQMNAFLANYTLNKELDRLEIFSDQENSAGPGPGPTQSRCSVM